MISHEIKSTDNVLNENTSNITIIHRFLKRNEHLEEICNNSRLQHKQNIQATLKRLLYSQKRSFISCIIAKVSNVKTMIFVFKYINIKLMIMFYFK